MTSQQMTKWMQNNLDYITAIPIILSLAAAAGSAYAWIQSGSRRRADEASVLTGVALHMVNELQEQYKDLRLEFEDYKVTTNNRIAEQARIIAEQAKRISVLEHENHALRTENNQLKSNPGKRSNL